MIPIIAYAAFVFIASLIGAGCEATIEGPDGKKPDGGEGPSGRSDASSDDAGIDAGKPILDGGIDSGMHLDGGEDAGSDGGIDGGFDGGSDAGNVGDAGDGGDGRDGGDGGDGGPFMREGIEERWTTLTQCQIKNLDIFDQKLYALCEGKPDHLSVCPLSQNLEPVVCEEVVRFDETPFETEAAPELMPQIHTDIGNGFSVVTFNATPGERGAFYVIDRANKTITEQVALDHWHLISGGGEIDIAFPNPQGAMLFGGALLIPFANGVVFEFPWNEDGTINWDVPVYYFQNATNKNPSLFLKKNEDNAWLVNRGSSGESPASIDKIVRTDFATLPEEENLRADIRPENNFFVGDVELNSLPILAVSPDQETILLASGTQLIAARPDAADGNIRSLDLEGAGNITSIQWWHREEKESALVSAASGEVMAVRLEDGAPSLVENNVPLQSGLGSSALDLSGCIFYQAYPIDSENSAVMAVRCDIFEPLE